MEFESQSRGDFYRQLLKHSQIFLTEVQSKSSSTDFDEEIEEKNDREEKSVNKLVDQKLVSTRHQCHQRLLACSRKKLRLLTLQEQNEKRHAGFQRFVDSLDEKRSANIRRYQMELKEYLLKRLETDRLKQELRTLHFKINQFKEEKQNYLSILDIVQKAIPLFPNGLFQSGQDGVKSLILRYQTLVETKAQFEQRDLSKEKQERRQRLQELILEHNTRIIQLSTRLAQLNQKLNDLQKNESIKEQQFINQIDFDRLNNRTLSQLLSAINYLYDRYRLTYQLKQSIADPTPILKLRTIQEFILYRIDLLQRAKH